MKKSLTQLLILSIFCVVISMFFSILSIRTSSSMTSDRTEKVLNEIGQDEEIDDVEGYGYIGSALSSMALDLGEAIGQAIFVVLMPVGMLFLMVILQAISRLVQIGENKKWKNTISQILTNFSIALQICAILMWIFDLMCKFNFNKVFVVLAIILNLIVVFMFKKELKIINQNIIEE